MGELDIIALNTNAMLQNLLRNFNIESELFMLDGTIECVLIVLSNDRRIYAIIENNILTIFAELRTGEVGDAYFAVGVHSTVLGVTVIPVEFGYMLKSESLLSGGILAGNVAETFLQFQASLERISVLARDFSD